LTTRQDHPVQATALIADDEPPARERLRSLLDEYGGIKIVAACKDGVEAVHAIEAAEPDMIFLDIEMPGLTGLEVVETIGVGQCPPVVFVTAYDAYAVRAFDLHAVDYLLKPFDRERFFRTTDRVMAKALADRPSTDLGEVIRAVRGAYVRRIPIRSRGRIKIVDVDEIEFITAEGNYVRIHSGGQEMPLVRDTLTNLERRLDPREFLRVHRGAIIRIDAVRELEPLFQGEYKISFAGGGSVRSSRRFRDEVHSALHIG